MLDIHSLHYIHYITFIAWTIFLVTWGVTLIALKLLVRVGCLTLAHSSCGLTGL